jgi:biopolymer transport protein ExbD
MRLLRTKREGTTMNRSFTTARNRRVRRIGACVAWLAVLCLASCSEKKPGNSGKPAGGTSAGQASSDGAAAGSLSPAAMGDPSDPEVQRRQVREQIARAAQIDKRLLGVIGQGSAHPGISTFPRANLGALLLSIDPLRAESPSKTERDRELRLGPPVKLAAAFRDGPDAEHASPIHVDDIRELTFERHEDELQGVAVVSVPEAIEAKITFTARLQDKIWRVERLAFPAWGAECVLKEGHWSVLGPACDETLRVDLPEAPFPEAAAVNPERLTLFLAATDRDGTPLVRAVCGIDASPIADPAEIGAIMEKVLKKRERTTEQAAVSIRADRRLTVASLDTFLRAVRQTGSTRFMLVVRNDDELREMPFEPAFDAEPDGPKTGADAPHVRVLSKEGGAIAAIEIESSRVPAPEQGNFVAELARLGGAKEVELRADPRLNLANFAAVLAELARPAKSAELKRRVVLALDEPAVELRIEPANPGASEIKRETPLDGAGK